MVGMALVVCVACRNACSVVGRDKFLYPSVHNMLIFNIYFADKYENMSLLICHISPHFLIFSSSEGEYHTAFFPLSSLYMKYAISSGWCFSTSSAFSLPITMKAVA